MLVFAIQPQNTAPMSGDGAVSVSACSRPRAVAQPGTMVVTPHDAFDAFAPDPFWLPRGRACPITLLAKVDSASLRVPMCNLRHGTSRVLTQYIYELIHSVPLLSIFRYITDGVFKMAVLLALHRVSMTLVFL
ncbi:hypothetical protein MRX96_005657 [Rhipicephalus microplus]